MSDFDVEQERIELEMVKIIKEKEEFNAAKLRAEREVPGKLQPTEAEELV